MVGKIGLDEMEAGRSRGAMRPTRSGLGEGPALPAAGQHAQIEAGRQPGPFGSHGGGPAQQESSRCLLVFDHAEHRFDQPAAPPEERLRLCACLPRTMVV